MTKRKLDFTRLDKAFAQKQREREAKKANDEFIKEEQREYPELWFWPLFLRGFRSEFEKFEEEGGAE